MHKGECGSGVLAGANAFVVFTDEISHLLQFLPPAMIKTKSIYEAASEEDGLRVLVTRYWPRGVSKDSVHLWLKDLSPTPALIKAYKSEKLSWLEFREAYLEGFDSSLSQEALGKGASSIKESLENMAQADLTLTLLCTCRDSSRCHRSLLSVLLEGVLTP